MVRLHKSMVPLRSQQQQEAADAHAKAIGQLGDSLPKSAPSTSKAELQTWAKHFSRAVDADTINWLSKLQQISDKEAKKLEAGTRNARLKEWRAMIGATTEGGKPKAPTRFAYRWLKGLGGWTRSPVSDNKFNDAVPHLEDDNDNNDEGEDDDRPRCTFKQANKIQLYNGSTCQVPLCDQAAVDREAESWAKLWEEKEKYGHIDWTDTQALPELAADEIRAAAASFPVGTGVGADNIAPRALLRLSDAALEALAGLLCKMEAAGIWSNELDLVLIVLLAKADGGLRPIGFFPR